MKKILVLIYLICLSVPMFAQNYDADEQCEDTCSHIHGIDLSHYQREVFWDAIGNNSKLAYVYLKATEGGDNIDGKYAENITMAKLNGLKVGSYHFFRPRTPIKLQLDNFTTQCRPDDQDLVPLIDIETKAGLSDSSFVDSLMTFLAAIEEYYHQKPMLYTGTNFYNRYLSGGLVDDYKLMIAQYTSYEPVLKDDRDITIWQYTGKGRIYGVKGNVDKSRFMGKHGLREIRFRRSNKKRR